jgi:hypothetical protein
MKTKSLTIILSAIAVLLLVPLIAMQFDSGVDWDLRDFITMGLLLFGTGVLAEFVLRTAKTLNAKIILCGAVLFLFFLIWAELAVGIFGTPFAGS